MKCNYCVRAQWSEMQRIVPLELHMDGWMPLRSNVWVIDGWMSSVMIRVFLDFFLGSSWFQRRKVINFFSIPFQANHAVFQDHPHTARSPSRMSRWRAAPLHRTPANEASSCSDPPEESATKANGHLKASHFVVSSIFSSSIDIRASLPPLANSTVRRLCRWAA